MKIISWSGGRSDPGLVADVVCLQRLEEGATTLTSRALEQNHRPMFGVHIVQVGDIIIVNILAPFPGLKSRKTWNESLDVELSRVGPKIVCGNFGAAVTPEETSIGSPWRGATARKIFAVMEDHGLVDAYRHLYPTGPAPNYFPSFLAGTKHRISHFFVSRELLPLVKDVTTLDGYGIHSPIALELRDSLYYRGLEPAEDEQREEGAQ